MVRFKLAVLPAKLFMKVSLIWAVEATKLPTSMLDVLPNTTPLGFTRNRFPLADRAPSMTDFWPPVIRFRATASRPGWANFTASSRAMLNWVQSTAIFPLCWVTVMFFPFWAMVPWPDWIWPPVGIA